MKKNVLLGIFIIVILSAIFVYTEYVHQSFASVDTNKTLVRTEPVPIYDTIIQMITPLDSEHQSSSEKEKQIQNNILKMEQPIRGIYVSAPAMNAPKARQRILDTIESTRINALVIDIKDSSGYVFLPEKNSDAKNPYSFNRTPYTQGAQDFIHSLKEKGVYLIARVVVFQDPLMSSHMPSTALKHKDGSIWKDRKGMSFLDPQNQQVWQYIRDLSLETKEFGFDEINFDYIRYPSDGLISQIQYNIDEGMTKRDMVEKFFVYLHDELKLKNNILISADIFGDTVRLQGDPGIGQTFEQSLPYFDAVAPMTYPSHFASGSYGITNPDAFPKEIMQGVAEDMNARYHLWCKSIAVEDQSTLCPVWKNRPWIQDFSLHHEYGVDEVKGQIEALEKNGITSWLVWNPASRYTINAFK